MISHHYHRSQRAGSGRWTWKRPSLAVLVSARGRAASSWGAVWGSTQSGAGRCRRSGRRRRPPALALEVTVPTKVTPSDRVNSPIEAVRRSRRVRAQEQPGQLAFLGWLDLQPVTAARGHAQHELPVSSTVAVSASPGVGPSLSMARTFMPAHRPAGSSWPVSFTGRTRVTDVGAIAGRTSTVATVVAASVARRRAPPAPGNGRRAAGRSGPRRRRLWSPRRAGRPRRALPGGNRKRRHAQAQAGGDRVQPHPGSGHRPLAVAGSGPAPRPPRCPRRRSSTSRPHLGCRARSWCSSGSRASGRPLPGGRQHGDLEVTGSRPQLEPPPACSGRWSRAGCRRA